MERGISTSTQVANIALAIGFVAVAGFAGYREIGLPPVIIVGGVGAVAVVAWSRTYLKRPVAPEEILLQ